MNTSSRITEFDKSVKNKFNVYNSLFLNLPFRGVHNTGIFIPLLHRACNEGLAAGKDPMEILDTFFAAQAGLQTEDEKIEFMFRVVQYVERQVVLYDSIEDAAFSGLQKHMNEATLSDFLKFAENKKSRREILEKLSDFSARIVFTAHPTQFYPPAVLEIITRLRSLITQNDINGIDVTLQQLGLTSLLNREKPTPFDEAKNVIYYLRTVYYDTMGEMYASMKKTLPSSDFENPDIIKLGFWPGGDRDGNPFVTADITLKVADELRMTLMKCYYEDIKSLSRKLTFPGIDEILKELKSVVYPSMFDPDELLHFQKILDPLYTVRKLLIEKYNSLYLDDLDTILGKIKLFKNHFAVLDIRQDHSVHFNTVEAILQRKGIIKQPLSDLQADVLLDILLNKDLTVDDTISKDSLIQETIRTFSYLPSLQERNGEEGCCRYIISNSEDIYSVLFVHALYRWCNPETDEVAFDIIPLFETMEGMKKAESIMRGLFAIPEYRNHVTKRNNRQTIMLGFSDGTKDGGYLKANWSIFKTKEILTSVCREHDIMPIFFDGRGGPPSRGGGKTHRFYISQSDRIANHEIQLTVQGQTITSRFGTKEHFRHNFEQLITAGISNSIFGKNNVIPESARSIIEELAEISHNKYISLKNHPMFIPYLETKSTLRFYGRTNIGSRPAKRGKSEKLELKDLRAIPFVGSWSQLKQNVPGYYGIGTALAAYVNSGRLEEMQNLFREVPFFKALILNSMMSLTKSNFNLTRYITMDPEYTEFWNNLHDEFLLSKEMMLLIAGYETLMQDEPVSKNSVLIREEIVLPLLVIQQYALQKVSADSDKKSVYEKIIERSMYGNINASRNSA